MRTIEIKQNDGGQRLDKYLSKRFKTMPKSLMYKYIRTKYIKLNGKKCDKSDFVKAGDVLTLYIKDEFFEENPERNYEFLKGPDRLDILYEDENLILIDKKQGLIVHQDKSYHFDSLVLRVQHGCQSFGSRRKNARFRGGQSSGAGASPGTTRGGPAGSDVSREAEKRFYKEEIPVGAIIVKNGEII